MYIAIEGIKGVGKSTLLDSLCQRLRDEKVKFSVVTPTRVLPYASVIEYFARTFPRLRQLDWFCQRLYTHRANGHARITDWSQPLILGDRSILTSLVTRWPDENSVMQWEYIQQVKARESYMPWPNCVIYLQMSLPAILLRLAQRCRDYGQQDECIEKLSSAIQAYQTLKYVGEFLGIPENMDWHDVDAQLSPQEVLEYVYTLIKKQCPEAWENKTVNDLALA